MTAMSWLHSLDAEQLTTLGCILAFILSRNVDTKDLAVIGLLIDNVSDTIGTIAAIESIQAFQAKKALLHVDAPPKEQHDLGQIVGELYEAITTLREIVDDLQDQNSSLRREIQELHNKSFR